MLNFKKTVLRVLTFLLCVTIVENTADVVITGFAEQTVKGIYNRGEIIDMAFFGSSVVMTGCDTAVFDEALGVHSYNLGTSQQPVAGSYYLMKELLKNHAPGKVLFCISFNQMVKIKDTLSIIILSDNMKWSLAKAELYKNEFSAEDYLDVLFPTHLYRDMFTMEAALPYLKRFAAKLNGFGPGGKSVSAQWEKGEGPVYAGNGFVSYSDANEQGRMGKISGKSFAVSDINGENVDYLKKIVALCEQNNTELVFYIHPAPVGTVIAGHNEELYAYFKEFAAENSLALYNFELVKPELFERKDEYYYDTDHLNAKGAREFGEVFAGLLGGRSAGGSVEAEDSFYASYDALYADTRRVTNVWLEAEKAGAAFCLTAGAVCGKTVKPEYQFLFKKADEEGWRIIQDYSPDFTASVPYQSGENDMVRVNARITGSDAEYEQYDELTVR